MNKKQELNFAIQMAAAERTFQVLRRGLVDVELMPGEYLVEVDDGEVIAVMTTYNSLTWQQCLLIENLQGNMRYGRANCTKGELRRLKKLGVISNDLKLKEGYGDVLKRLNTRRVE